MKLTVTKETLSAGLAVVAPTAPSRGVLPVLSNVYIEGYQDESGSGIRLVTSDLSATTIYNGPAVVEESGKTTISLKALRDLVKYFGEERVTMTLDATEATLGVHCGTLHTNFKTIAADEFPDFTELLARDEIFHVTMDPRQFKEIVSKVAFSAANTDTRPALSGTLMSFNGAMKAISTDGFRLSLYEWQEATARELKDTDLIVPASTLARIASLVAEGDVVRISQHGSHNIMIQVENTTWILQLIEATYPDVSQIIPSGYRTRMVVDSAQLRQACKLAMVMARSANHLGTFTVKAGKNGAPASLAVSAAADETGDNTSEVTAEVEGEEVQIGFDMRYVTAFLSNVTMPQVVMEFNGHQLAGVMREIGNSNYLHIIMPMHK